MSGDAQHRALATFRAQFALEPLWAAQAPGRVNLIGEHTDYNDGLVLPIAIDRRCVAAAAPAADPEVSRLVAVDLPLARELDVREPLRVVDRGAGESRVAVRRGSAESYIAGVIAQFQRRGHRTPNLDIVVASDVPPGGGLASSAAVEVAIATLLEQVLGVQLDGLEKARLCQRAEHEFAGVPCGLMDQLASVMGRAGHAMLIDCRDDVVTRVPMPAAEKAGLLIINTNVRHALASGEYEERRATCASAAARLGVGSLRDVDEQMLESRESLLDDEQRRCTGHVVSENRRVRAAAEALRAGELGRLGELMRRSHASLRDDYRVSCAELDTLVEALARCEGVFGARMTGGGFGGCVVAVVRPDSLAAAVSAAENAYQRRHNRACTAFTVSAAEGAGGVRLS